MPDGENQTQHIDMDNAELADIHLQIRRACHDLNAPLRAVHGFADILRQREAEHLSERGQLYLDRMVGAVTHMEQVVEGLHSYGRLATHHLKPTSIPLHAFSERLMATHYRAAVASGGLHLHADADLQWVSDPELLQTILCALVDNALLFTAVDTPPAVTVTWQVNGDHLQLSVQDQGIGIAAEHQQYIFKLFERLHNREEYPGAGTGLTLVWKAAQILQGSIGINAVENQGTRIEVSMPRMPD